MDKLGMGRTSRREVSEKAQLASNHDKPHRNLLRDVVEKIVCHFSYDRKNGKPMTRRSRQVSVTVVPAAPESACVTSDPSLSPCCGFPGADARMRVPKKGR
jgi:hypothetical protein